MNPPSPKLEIKRAMETKHRRNIQRCPGSASERKPFDRNHICPLSPMRFGYPMRCKSMQDHAYQCRPKKQGVSFNAPSFLLSNAFDLPSPAEVAPAETT